MDRLKSRKFWLTVAIILGGVASTISGACTDNNTLMVIGMICGGLAAIIYNICETIVDTDRVSANTTETTVYIDEEETDDGESVG